MSKPSSNDGDAATTAETPLDAIAVSRRFRRSRQIESRVGVVLGTLHRYSRIHRLGDGRYQSRATI